MLFLGWMQQDWGPESPWEQMKQQQRKINELMDGEIAERRLQPEANRTDIEKAPTAQTPRGDFRAGRRRADDPAGAADVAAEA